jgi:hypothetical protein
VRAEVLIKKRTLVLTTNLIMLKLPDIISLVIGKLKN